MFYNIMAALWGIVAIGYMFKGEMQISVTMLCLSYLATITGKLEEKK